jgi:hypothetical protein
MNELLEMKKSLLMAHPTFCCPVTKKVMDYREIEIVKFFHGTEKTDIMSKQGIDILKKLPAWIELKFSIIESIDQL